MSDRGPADEEDGDTANSGSDTAQTHAYTPADTPIKFHQLTDKHSRSLSGMPQCFYSKMAAEHKQISHKCLHGQLDTHKQKLLDAFTFKYIFIKNKTEQKRECHCTVFRVLSLSNAAIWSGSLIVVLRQGQGSDTRTRR